MDTGGRRTHVLSLALAASLIACLLAATPAAAKGPKLTLSEKSAVPGQVVLLSGKGLEPKKAKVQIGGKKAEVATRSKRKLGVVVPDLKPGKSAVVAKQKGKRLKGSLKVGKGFDGELQAELDPLRAATAEIGRAGGGLAVTAADGTTFTLSVPAGALPVATAITMTPVKSIPGFPLSGQPLAVDLAPDGLEFATPATLRIDPAKTLQGPVAGFTFAESDPGLDLQTPQGSGASLSLSIEHFSTSGASTISERDFFALIGRLIIEDLDNELDFEDIAEFARALSVFAPAFNFRCADNPTCAWLFGLVVDVAEDHIDTYQCPGQGDEVHGSLRINRMTQMLEEDGVLRLLGRNELAARLESIRRCETAEFVGEVADAARSDALDPTQVNPINSRDQARADLNGDGEIANCEWAIYAAGVAAQQGFADLQGSAIDACEAGLRAAVDEARPKCDEAATHAEGLAELRKAESIDASMGLATAEIVAAREYCVKITVTPPNPTVEVGEELDFTATAKDPSDISFAWSADRGTIDGAGLLTAPTTPGPLTITATSDQHHERTGRAQVTVACPAGQVELQGQCRQVDISISPTQVTLAPGATQQFTATVTGISDTRVSWSASCGSVNQAGLYTAPQSEGNCTVTASSVAAPSKQASATVLVEEGLPIELTLREPFVFDGAQMVGRDSNLPIPGEWTASTSSSGGTADQTSDVQASASGQGWLEAAHSASAFGLGAETQSYQEVRFTMEGPATLSCTGNRSVNSAYGGAAIILIDVVHGGAVQGPTLPNGAFDVDVELQGSSWRLITRADATSPGDGGTGAGALDVTCDFDRPVEVR